MRVITEQIGISTTSINGEVVDIKTITRTYIKPSKFNCIIKSVGVWINIFAISVNITSICFFKSPYLHVFLLGVHTALLIIAIEKSIK